MSPESNEAGRRVLTSWKAIAAFFDRDVRTVQRWEEEEGLPVHRHWHRRQGSVYAYADELDAWRRGRGVMTPPVVEPTAADAGATPAPRRRVPLAAAAGVSVVLIAAAAIVGWRAFV